MTVDGTRRGRKPQSRHILGTRVDASTYEKACERVLAGAARGASEYVCVATVHMVMESFDDPALQGIVNGADLVTSDGMPLVWGLKLQGIAEAERVYGPTLTPILCARAAQRGIPVGFYGGGDAVLEALVTRLRAEIPALEIVYATSPPYRELAPEEDEKIVREIADSGARILFVGLGCPKQERWMAAHRGRVPAVMLGVGAAFDFIAGGKRQAPAWMQAAGLEWLFRLASEPRRLWKRYLRHNPRFVYHFARQLLRTGPSRA